MDFIIENRAIDGAVIQADVTSFFFFSPRNSSVNLCVLCIMHMYVTDKPRKFLLMKQLYLEA